MEDFNQRLFEEHKELVTRLEKLTKALHTDGFRQKVGKYQYALMRMQANGMRTYIQALELRMADLDIVYTDNYICL